MRNNRGVTLVALVVTIIVLVILATVSIGMVLGNQGIFTQAEEAKKLTTNAQIAEEEGFNQLYEQLAGYMKGKSSIPEEPTLPSTLETNPYLPGTGSTVIENSTLDTGLTVKDKNDNEWVWVIVPKNVTASATDETAIYTALTTYATAYRLSAYTDTWYDGCGLTETEYNTNKSKMLNSIKTYGGFWIGRYELGTDTQRKANSDALTTPLVQEDKYPYNYTTCSEAQERSTLLAPETNITSSLLYGIQWDLTLKFMEEKATELGATTTDRQTKLKTDSSSWGNYSNSTFDITKGKYSTDNGTIFIAVPGTYTKPTNTSVLLTTGTIQRNKVLNIYDIAGNEYEWTLEKSTDASNPCTDRGGSFGYTGTVNPSIHRYSSTTSSSYSSLASRPTLFK